MEYKWIGAILIMAGCGGFGFCLAHSQRYQEKSLRNLTSALDFMACELQYRMTPLPELCQAVSQETSGELRQLFQELSGQLLLQNSESVADAMEAALQSCSALPPKTRNHLLTLGRTLGRFDLDGQLRGLEAVRSDCRRDLEGLSSNRDLRLRNYQTLGLCAGAALAIILI